MTSSLPEILYRGSVKNVRGARGKSPYIFEFSDRYSIFDWGQMPDLLEGKGQSLAFLAWFFFDFLGQAEPWKNWRAPDRYAGSAVLQKLRERGLLHHAIGLVDDELQALSLDREANSPTRNLAVKAVQVIAPESSLEDGRLVWNYSPYLQKPINALVPLEVIFRFGVPEGSSLLKRTGHPAYCRDIGLEKAPAAGDRFEEPVIEMSTKLENKDRYISHAEARQIAGLEEAEFKALRELTALIALRLKDCFAEIGVELWDGKFEFAFTDDRDFMLVDAIGPDELRLMVDGVHLSKEVLRSAYRGTPWMAALERAKALGDERGEKNWKRICTDELGAQPGPLTPDVKERAEMIYKGLGKALSKKYLSRTVFADAWDLTEVVAGFKRQRKVSA